MKKIIVALLATVFAASMALAAEATTAPAIPAKTPAAVKAVPVKTVKKVKARKRTTTPLLTKKPAAAATRTK